MHPSQSPNQLCGQWHYPTDIRFGVGYIAQLPQVCRQLGICQPLVVTDKGLAQLPLIAEIQSQLHQADLTAGLFSAVDPNPSGHNVEQGVSCFRAGGHDGVIAVGGGSGLDAAKAIALMAGQTRPLWDFEDVGDNFTRVDVAAMAPVIAIPTTAGTGSEVGRAAVILDTEQQQKKIIFHPRMMPAVVIADPALTVGLPADITAATGMDAFVHNLEAYLAPGFHPMADGIAIQGMKMIKDWLPSAVKDGTDLVARSHMMAASTMGATAFQKGLGAVHALAHPLGAHYGAHHGLLNAILLPYVLNYNHQAISEKIAALSHQLQLPEASFIGFMQWLRHFSATLNIPTSLGAIGISASQSRILGEQAQADAAAAGNPVELSAAEYSSILINAIEGHF